MTRLDGVQHPHRPTFQEQLPDSNCKIVDAEDVMHWLGAESCTAYAFGMFVDRATGGRQRPSGCSLRRMTRPLDVTGGLTLNQIATPVRDRYGIAVSVFVGGNVVSPKYLARQLRAGRPFVVQGNTQAYLGTKYKVTDGDVNHAEMWAEVRGGSLDVPGEVLVYDPCADHRRSDIDQGPTWIPWSIALRFLAYLRPNGPGTARLGPGKVYCAMGPDTEPHVTLLSGATQARPFPDRVRAKDPNDPRTAIHSRPGGVSTVTRHVANGTLLRLYQYRDGWGYNDDGTECVLLRNTDHVGGST